MQKKILSIIFLNFFLAGIVHAEACSLDKQVEVNNAAGTVSVSTDPFIYEYKATNPETGEEETVTDYVGTISIYNLTSDIYAVVKSTTDTQTVYYDAKSEGEALISTKSMDNVKNYQISIYPTNKECGTSSVRELNITIPRLNNYYNDGLCKIYPDYFYCSQFMTADNISYDDFRSGIAAYAKQANKDKDENRHHGIINNTTSFVKNHWLIAIIIIVVIVGLLTTVIIYKNKKRKEHGV